MVAEQWDDAQRAGSQFPTGIVTPEAKHTAYPEAKITKTKLGPMDSSELCQKIKTFPYTMTLVDGAEAQAEGKLWWPFK